jgi:hypothetical protein
MLSIPKSFEEIAGEVQPLVQKFRRAGSHKATFLCPAHDDKTPSAWIAQNEEGWTHAHCSVCGNLRETFNAMGVFFSAGRQGGQSRPKKDRSREYYDTLRAKTPENKNFTRRQLEVLYWGDGPLQGEPESTLTYDVFPVDGPLLAQRIAHARKHPPMESPFSAPLTADGIEQTHAIVLRYLQEHRKLDDRLQGASPFDGLLFSHTSLDGNMGKEARALLEWDVKAVLITPLRNPAKHHERAWQETWLDADGRKITRHYPASVAQKGRVFYRKTTEARTLLIGEGLENSWTIAMSQSMAVDVIAAMSMSQFAHLEITKRYDHIILCPDLEPHGKGLQAILNLAARWLPTNPAQLSLLRPDGKDPHDPIESKLDMNDLSPEQREQLRPIPLDADNLLHPDHPMRQWSNKPIDEIYQDFKQRLQVHLDQPGTGKKMIDAIGTGVGKSHALAETLPQAKESVLICAPTREGRKALSRNLDPETQEHHGRGEIIDPERIIENPERYCPIYFNLKGEAPPAGVQPPGNLSHVAMDADETPPPSILSALGFPISPTCNNTCPRGLATLYVLTNGKQGANTGAPICSHQLKRLDHWYQESHLTSTHAGANGDPTLFKVDGKLRGKIEVDEAPTLIQEKRWTSETLYQLRMSTFYNHQHDQRFHAEADREERLEAYQKMMPWIAHLENLLMTGWKDGNIPPLPGYSWQEFHDLVEKYKAHSYVTIFERAYRKPVNQKHYGPILLDWLSEAIRNGTAFYDNQSITAISTTAIGDALKSSSRKQDMHIMTATPSLALKTLCNSIFEAYPATPNLRVNWTRGRNWSATALQRNRSETLHDLVDILEALPEQSAVIMTKAYKEAVGPENFPLLHIGHWYRDHEGHNRMKDRTHLEIIGLQMLPQETYLMLYESTRKLYDLPWQPASVDDPWSYQYVGVSYLPGSETSCYLPENNPDFAYFIREYHTIEIAQAIGRIRASRRLDEILTVNIRTNIPLLPLFGVVVSTFDGHSHRQLKVHDRAATHVESLVQMAFEAGLRPSFRNIDRLSKEQTGKGIRYTNWKQVVDGVIEKHAIPNVNAPSIDLEALWILTSQEAILAEARRQGDLMRRREAAIPGRGDAPDGEALIDTIRIMDRYRCDSAQAAERILADLHKNRHHPGDEYVQSLREIILRPIPEYYWLDEDAQYA